VSKISCTFFKTKSQQNQNKTATKSKQKRNKIKTKTQDQYNGFITIKYFLWLNWNLQDTRRLPVHLFDSNAIK